MGRRKRGPRAFSRFLLRASGERGPPLMAESELVSKAVRTPASEDLGRLAGSKDPPKCSHRVWRAPRGEVLGCVAGFSEEGRGELDSAGPAS